MNKLSDTSWSLLTCQMSARISPWSQRMNEASEQSSSRRFNAFLDELCTKLCFSWSRPAQIICLAEPWTFSRLVCPPTIGNRTNPDSQMANPSGSAGKPDAVNLNLRDGIRRQVWRFSFKSDGGDPEVEGFH